MFTTGSLISAAHSFFKTDYSNPLHQLADRIKEGKSTNTDQATIMALLDSGPASENYTRFFNDPVVQRRLLKGLLDGSITDEGIWTGLKNCTPCIEPEDQIKLIESRAVAINDIDPHEAAKPAFILRFFPDIPEHLQENLTHLKIHNTKQEDQKTVATHEADSCYGDDDDAELSFCPVDISTIILNEEPAHQIMARDTLNILDLYQKK